MSDFIFLPSPPRAELVRELRRRIAGLGLSLRVLAEEVLGESSTIDLVAVDSNGRVVLIMIGEAGEDLELFTRALAQRAWVRARIRDWLKFAPDLDLRPDAVVRVLLLCPTFQQETRAAATDLGDEIVELATYRCLQNAGRISLLLERPEGLRSESSDSHNAAATHATSFRSGLTEEDFNLSPDEIRELEGP